VDWGYDVADYLDVHPDFGTLEDLDTLIAEARTRRIELWLDLVPNHTSDRHPWFSDRPEYYVWSDHIPNDWTSIFTGGSAWEYDARRKRYYLHQFTPQQPDLDWWNADVRAEFERILRFWFERGVAGFRIDVAHALIKDAELRDGVRFMRERPETHEIFRQWQAIAHEYDPKPTLMGETYVPLAHTFPYYAHLDLVQNFDFVRARFAAGSLRSIVERVEAGIPADRTPLWFGSNHDHSRLATRWARGDERKARAALFVLLTLRGSVILYQGDELALTDGEVPRDRITDIADPPRDPERTPMPWTRSGEEWREPWLPLADASRNVADQRDDPASTLNYVRELIGWRRSLAGEPYRGLPSPPGVLAYARGDVTCAVNLSDTSTQYDGRSLAPWEAIVV
jgi:alpha-glucosidase